MFGRLKDSIMSWFVKYAQKKNDITCNNRSSYLRQVQTASAAENSMKLKNRIDELLYMSTLSQNLQSSPPFQSFVYFHSQLLLVWAYVTDC